MTDPNQAPLNDPVASILSSKTFWTNLLGPVFVWAGAKYGLSLDADTQVAVIGLVMGLANIILRRISSRPVAFTAPLATK